MLQRLDNLRLIRAALRRSPVVALIGPRQCGKTTLARQVLPADSNRFFDLESPRSLARLDEPQTELEALRGIVVIDEVQRRPDLFPILRVLVDRPRSRTRFLILGSASPQMLRQSTETLAGRVETIRLAGFDLSEVGGDSIGRHWRRGGFPRSFLARSEGDSVTWRSEFIQTFLERDLPQLGFGIPAAALFRFWTMLAHYHGQRWNAAEPARSLAVSEPTVRRYLDLLTDLFMVRQLRPWHENLGKRQIRAPKVYLRDSGLLHSLLGIRNERDLANHPKRGASWEGYAIEEIIRVVRPDEAFHWATHGGAELDLLMFKNGRRLGVECKRADAPKMTPSMRLALRDLRLEQLVVIYPGSESYTLGERIRTVPLRSLAEMTLAGLFPAVRRQIRRAPD